MAIIMAKITGRVLVQIGDGEPVEIGTIEIPIEGKLPTPNVETHSTVNQRVHPITAAEREAFQGQWAGRRGQA